MEKRTSPTILTYIMSAICGECGQVQLIDVGDLNDITGIDVDGFICVMCECENIFDSEDDSYDEDGGILVRGFLETK